MRMQRTLPPTAAPIPFKSLLSALWSFGKSHAARELLTRELQQKFCAQGVFLVSSGKSALTVILKALAASSARRKVIIPAYTCYSVPSAIVKAGLEVVLCDTDPSTLDFKFDELKGLLNEQVLCVVSTHLFGLPADVDRTKQLCQDRGVMVVEDAAQAMGGQAAGRLIGTVGDVAFFSLGRGKNITSGTGGIIVTGSRDLAELIQREYAQLKEPPLSEALFNWIQLILMRACIHPALYWLPAGLPFLRLGETKFYTDFESYRMDEVRARQLRDWDRRLSRMNSDRRHCADRLMKQLEFHLRGMQPIAHADGVYLRLPVLTRDRETRDSLCRLSRETGCGISLSYPTTIQDIPELAGRLPARRYPGAEEVVNRLVTFPTHRFVRDPDVQRMDRLLEPKRVPGLSGSGQSAAARTANRPYSTAMKEVGR